MNPIEVMKHARENTDWNPDPEWVKSIEENFKDGKIGMIHPDLLKMYAEDALHPDAIARAWKLPVSVIRMMYEKANITPWMGSDTDKLIDLSKYEVELKTEQDDTHNDIIKYLLNILNDRSIPEENKVNIRKQYEEIMRIKSILMKPPTVVLKPKQTE